MKLHTTYLYELREMYQDCRDGYIFYADRLSHGGCKEDSQWLSFYDGQLHAMERVFRTLDFDFDDFMTIVSPNE